MNQLSYIIINYYYIIYHIIIQSYRSITIILSYLITTIINNLVCGAYVDNKLICSPVVATLESSSPWICVGTPHVIILPPSLT